MRLVTTNRKHNLYIVLAIVLALCGMECSAQTDIDDTNKLKAKVPNCTEVRNICWHEYMYMVEVDDSLYGLVDRNGNYFVPPIYNHLRFSRRGHKITINKGAEIHIYHENFRNIHWEKRDGKFSVVNIQQERLTDKEFDKLDFSTNGNEALMTANDTRYSIDTVGNLHQCGSLDGSKIVTHHEHFYKVEKNGKVGLIDEKYNTVIPTEYEELTPYIGKCIVKKNGKFGIITFHNNIIQNCKFDSITVLEFDYERVHLFGECGTDEWEELHDEIFTGENGAIDINYEFTGRYYVDDLLFPKYLEFPKYYLVSLKGKHFILRQDGKTLLAKDAFNMDDYEFVEIYNTCHSQYLITRNKKKEEVKWQFRQGLIVPLGIEEIKSDGVGNYLVSDYKRLQGVMDKNGKTIVPIQYEKVEYDSSESKYLCYINGIVARKYKIVSGGHERHGGHAD